MTFTIQGVEVGPIGFGLMGLTTRREQTPEDQALAVMKEALAHGANYWNGGEFYGPPNYNSLTLLNKYFAVNPSDASKILFNCKGCARPGPVIDGSPAFTRESIENSISLLGDTGGFIHQFESARKDPKVAYAETIKAIDEYVKAGKIGGVALSEVNANTIRKAVQTVGKVAAVEVSLSLWNTEVLTNGVVDVCAEYGIPIIAYSPLGYGFLTGQIKKPEDIPEGDIRRTIPRFQGDNFYENLRLLDAITALAERKGATPAQIAINWIVALAKKPGMPPIIPIPGASTVERVRENCKLVDLTKEDMSEIDDILKRFEVKGDRYNEHIMAMADHDTE